MLERLQKIIAHAGIASRRHAEQLILSGQVRVNGKTVTELGTKADPSKDKIEAAGRTVESEERHAYLLMHKPTEVVSALTDPEGRKTLRNFLRGFPQRVYPVGSLDYTASGLVLLTNDGALTAQMLKNWSSFAQLYHIKIKGRLTRPCRQFLVRGADVRRENGWVAPRPVPRESSDRESEACRPRPTHARGHSYGPLPLAQQGRSRLRGQFQEAREGQEIELGGSAPLTRARRLGTIKASRKLLPMNRGASWNITCPIQSRFSPGLPECLMRFSAIYLKDGPCEMKGTAPGARSTSSAT